MSGQVDQQLEVADSNSVGQAAYVRRSMNVHMLPLGQVVNPHPTSTDGCIRGWQMLS